MNLTTGEAMEYPIYHLSLNSLPRDLDYSLSHDERVSRKETACEDNSPCLLITITYDNIIRRTWINRATGQQVKQQTAQQISDGTETILYTQTFLPVEQMDAPPQEVLDIFSKVLFPTP